MPHRYEMGIVGNCSYMGYIDTLGDVRWLCMPRFDSFPIFGSLLADGQGGSFRLVGAEATPLRQYYVDNTNILVTEIQTAGGSVRITDCAPRFQEHGRRFRPNMLLRRIEPLSGSPLIQVRCRPMSPVGANIEIAQGSNHLRFLGMPSTTRLTTDLTLANLIEGTPFLLDGPHWLAFTYGPPLEAPLEETAERFLRETTAYWQDWVKSTSIHGIYQPQVIRSALVLKLHQFEDTGAIIASGTTSLPESPGSGRNWDYRFCWMRDSYYTIRAFADIGHFNEMERYFRYLEDIVVRSQTGLSPLYTITGQRVPDEVSPDWIGYQGERPVRLGNGANTQQQFDVYGQMLTAILPLYIDHRLQSHRPRNGLDMLRRLLGFMERDFDIPDAGIWEFRNLRQQHSYTYLFHWAGANAAVRIAKWHQDSALLEQALRLEKKARAVIESCWIPSAGFYAQAVGSTVADASTLQLICMGYLKRDPQRAMTHLRALEKELAAPDSLFFRYRNTDDFGAPDTAFLITAFWRIEALATLGLVDEARQHLETILQSANHVGLFSEDVSLDGGQWGNFPQTYSHVGLMNAVARIASREDKPFFQEEFL